MEDIGLVRDQVTKGVKALIQYVKKRGDTQEELLNTPQNVILQIGFKKLPNITSKTVKVVLPNSLLLQTTEVCLFVKDLSKVKRDFSPSVKHFKSLLDKHDIKCKVEIIPLKALKLEYKEFEAKRNLSNRYDIYLADDRVVRFLPRLLGKAFLGKKRFPVQINLTLPDLKKEFDKALRTSHCIMGGRGSTCIVRVAHTGQDEVKVEENLITAINRIAETIPGGPTNIKCLHVKTERSPALPIYVSEGVAQDVLLPSRKRKLELDEPEELSTIEKGEVRVTPWGSVQVIQKDREQNVMQRKKRKPNFEQKAVKNRKPNRQKKLNQKPGDKPSQQRTVRKTKVTQNSQIPPKSKKQKLKQKKLKGSK